MALVVQVAPYFFAGVKLDLKVKQKINRGHLRTKCLRES